MMFLIIYQKYKEVKFHISLTLGHRELILSNLFSFIYEKIINGKFILAEMNT